MGTRSREQAVFGPVSSITTAPISIGNSVSGSAPIVQPTQDGVRVLGRDFMFPLSGISSTKTDWAMVGGCPIIPHAFVASVLRSYSSIYAEFVVHGLTFHYVTAMPTTSLGDVMFYVNKDRGAALLDTTNNNFMSVVLSDPNTVLGPLWHNHSATYKPVFKTYSTSILNGEDLRDQGPGELFIYMKTSASSTLGSAGYVLVDFDISFKTLQTNPRELSFPLTRLKYGSYGFSTPVAPVVQGQVIIWTTNGATLDGGSVPGGIFTDTQARQGDIYKVVMQPDFGSYVGTTPSTFLGAVNAVSDTVRLYSQVVIDDGFTAFAVIAGPSSGAGNAGLILYPSYAAAMAQTSHFVYFVTSGNTGVNIPTWMSLVGNTNPALYQANY